MTESLPDAWSVHGTELDDEPKRVEELAREFQKQQENDYPDCDGDQQERYKRDFFPWEVM